MICLTRVRYGIVDLSCVFWECIYATELLMALCCEGCGNVCFFGKCWCY